MRATIESSQAVHQTILRYVVAGIGLPELGESLPLTCHRDLAFSNRSCHSLSEWLRRQGACWLLFADGRRI